MTVYIFSALKSVRDIVPVNGLVGLVHDEAAYTLTATIPMDLSVVPGEHLGFMCVDNRFRMFTVTKAENRDFDGTTIITATDTAVQELKETVVEDLQQLDATLYDSVTALIAASDARSSWSVTGSGPDTLKKHRAYYTTLWTMLETLSQLYEWRIIPYYIFTSGYIAGRVIELAADTAVFRGRILQSKKDASNVYVIKTSTPITRLYGMGPSVSSEAGVSENMTFAEAEWSIAAGDPADKPKEQTYVEDAAAVAKYGVRSGVASFTSAEDELDLLQQTWDWLQKVKEPTCTVEANVQDLEKVPGYEGKIIRLGDLVPVRLSNAAMEEARVIGIKRDYVKPWLTKVTIGDKTASLQNQVSGLLTNALHTFETLTIYKNRFHEDEALIQLNAEFIQMNAGQIEMNAQLIQLTAKNNEGDIAQIRIEIDSITAKVEDAEGKVASLELSLSDLESRVVLKAEYEEDKNAMLTMISNAEESIATLEANHGDRIAALELYTSDLESRVLLKAEYEENREADLQLIANAEESVATLEAKHGEQIAALELKATEQGSLIEAKADLILLDGYVKADELETEVLTVVDTAYITGSLSGEMIDVQSLVAASVNTEYMSADSITTDSLSVGGETLASSTLTMGTTTATLFAPDNIDLSHSHAVTVNGDGTITLGEVSSTGGSFNIADTQYYKDGVSAAKESVTLTSMGWQGGGRNIVEASNGKTYTVELPPFSASGGTTFNADHQTTVHFYTSVVSGPLRSVTVDASSVYDDGYTDGYNANSGADSVTLSSSGWVGGVNTVTASNGKSLAVNLPSFSASGGTSWSNNRTTVYFSTPSVSSPLASKTVDASSIYSNGVSAGYNAGFAQAISGAMLELEGETVYCYGPDGSAGPTLDISSSLTESYNSGYADATPTSASRVSTYDSANNAYNVTAVVKSADGTTKDFDLVAIDASAAYDAGYAAGYQAAKDATTVEAGVTWSNPAQYYAMVRYWASAKIDGEEVAYTSASESKNISGYV